MGYLTVNTACYLVVNAFSLDLSISNSAQETDKPIENRTEQGSEAKHDQ